MSTSAHPAIERDCIDTLRLLAADAVEKAQSGHPGTPMEAAPIAFLLYSKHLRHNPKDPQWPGRDRFVLSCGHASMLLYSVLHLSGYDLSLSDLQNFRQWHSATPGHPEFRHTPGVETTTGPLGQGCAVATGMALGARYLQQQLDSTLFDYHTYCLCSDGDLMEGVASEVASLAGHLQLGNMTHIYLDNRITIEGDSQLAFSEEVATRYLAYGWHVQRVEAENLAEVDQALSHARQDTRPSLIIARSHIGYGAPAKQDTAAAHGAPLGAEELAATKQALGYDPEASFQVAPQVYRYFQDQIRQAQENCHSWYDRLQQQLQDGHEALRQWHQICQQGAKAPELPSFTPEDGKLATRKAGGKLLNEAAAKLPFLIGGSADLAPSNNTSLNGETSFSAQQAGRNLHFGIREHAMGAVVNGICHTPGLRGYGATFLVFSDYMKPPMRLAAMMGINPIYIFTHDSIGVGEDGPTHQPIEQLAMLRAIPNLLVLRPGDANETRSAYKVALNQQQRPSALILSRQGLPVLDRQQWADASGTAQGAYILAPEEKDLEGIIIATGSEIHPALAAQQRLNQAGHGIRLVSMPCWELFEEQPRSYQEEVLPPHISVRLAVEAGCSQGWHRYVGSDGATLCLDHFGASAPGDRLMQEFGFTAEAISEKVMQLLGRA